MLWSFLDAGISWGILNLARVVGPELFYVLACVSIQRAAGNPRAESESWTKAVPLLLFTFCRVLSIQEALFKTNEPSQKVGPEPVLPAARLSKLSGSYETGAVVGWRCELQLHFSFIPIPVPVAYQLLIQLHTSCKPSCKPQLQTPGLPAEASVT